MDRFVDFFLKSGYNVLLAHPERCRSLQEEPELIDTFLPPDMPIQLTSHSLAGEFGERPWEAGMAFLSSGRPMVIASDAHSSGRRAPVLSRAMEIAAGIVGRQYAEQMVYDLPLALLEGRAVWPP